jgi:hypothetical protein
MHALPKTRIAELYEEFDVNHSDIDYRRITAVI